MPTWMVVEDEPDIYDVLLAMFEIWGIEGVAFVDGGEAVSWVDGVDHGRVRGELPELAILDIRLPEVTGPEVGSRLRRSPILGNIAIVLITAYHMSPEEETEAIQTAGADLLLYKPLPGMTELRQKMDGVITKHQQLKAAAAAAASGSGNGSAPPAPEAPPAPPESPDAPPASAPDQPPSEKPGPAEEQST
ncbi:MAG: response regulator [Chloroflexi bacterium]|nr:response regulator [Chloroflexota bacterium]